MNEFRKIGTFAKSVSRKNLDLVSSADVYSVTKYDGFIRSLSYFKKQVFSRDLSTYKIVRKGEFAYSTIHLDEGAIGLFQDNEALISPMYTVFEVDESIDIFYLNYLLSSDLLLNKYGLTGQGSVNRRKSIPFSAFAELEVRVPPLDEQKKIAEVISRIENLISSLKVKIRKHEIINIACGKDLIRHKSKDQIFKISDLYEVKSGSTPTRSRPEFFCKEGGVPWLKTMDLTNDYVYKTDEELKEFTFNKTNLKIFPKGSVLIAMYGGWNQIGRTGILTRESSCNQAMSVLIPHESVLPEFINMQLVLNVSYWKKIAASSRKDPNITKSDVNGMKIYIPSLIEQERISKIYCSQLDFINKLKDKLQNLIHLKSAISYELLSGHKRADI